VRIGLSLGYRKGARRGVFCVRRWVDGGYVVATLDGVADDREPANGVDVLSYDQAKQKAYALAEEAAKEVKGATPRRRAKTAPYTVREAIEAYLAYLDRETKSGRNGHSYANTSILPQLGHIAVRDLDRETLSSWLHDLAASPRKSRGNAGVLAPPATEEDKRKRRSTANRIYAVLHAALNMAFTDDKVDSDSAWQKVKPLKQANAARARAFTAEEMRALVDAAEEPFRSLLVAARHTGARYGELCRLATGDYEPHSDSLLIRYSKAGKSRSIILTKEACDFFARLCTGRATSDPMLTKADGTPWRSGDQDRPMKRVCKAAGVKYAGFHALRHSYATAALEAKIPMHVVAQNLGHADISMLQRHYAHITDEHRRSEIQGKMTPLNLDEGSNIVTPDAALT
jgi:integrase